MNPTHLPLPFPLRGVDVSTEYELQPELTAPEAANVRGVEPATARERGGSRPGLSRWIDARVGDTEAMIQCLDAVVTADADALLVAPGNGGGDGGDDWIPDPSTNNEITNGADDINDPDYDPDEPGMRNPGPRFVPDGGSGVQPDPHTPSGRDEGAGEEHGWVFVQKKTLSTTFSLGASRTDQVTLDSATLRHQLIVVLYSTAGDDDGVSNYQPGIAVSDSLGNTYTVARDEYYTPFADQAGVTAHIAWARNETGGACTVSVQNTNTNPGGTTTSSADLIVLEYRGMETSTPADGATGAGGNMPNDGTAPTGTMSGGAVPITGSTRLVVGLFHGDFLSPHPTYTPAAGWTVRHNAASTSNVQVIVLEELSSAAAETPTVDYDHSANPFDGFNWVVAAAGWRFA